MCLRRVGECTGGVWETSRRMYGMYVGGGYENVRGVCGRRVKKYTEGV